MRINPIPTNLPEIVIARFDLKPNHLILTSHSLANLSLTTWLCYVMPPNPIAVDSLQSRIASFLIPLAQVKVDAPKMVHITLVCLRPSIYNCPEDFSTDECQQKNPNHTNCVGKSPTGPNDGKGERSESNSSYCWLGLGWMGRQTMSQISRC